MRHKVTMAPLTSALRRTNFWFTKMEKSRLLYSESQAADLLSVSPKTLSRLRKAGSIQFVKIGKAIRYDLESLTDLIHLTRSTAISIG